MSDVTKLAGLWFLTGYALSLPDGSVVEPIGADPVGRLLYAPDGFMSAHIMARGDDPVSYLAYCGRYRIMGDTVLHDVEISTRPGMAGTVMERRMAWQDGTLVLTAEGVPWQGGHGTGRLSWKRGGAPADAHA